jgi:hypothetical protein
LAVDSLEDSVSLLYVTHLSLTIFSSKESQLDQADHENLINQQIKLELVEKIMMGTDTCELIAAEVSRLARHMATKNQNKISQLSCRQIMVGTRCVRSYGGSEVCESGMCGGEGCGRLPLFHADQASGGMSCRQGQGAE